MLMSAQRKVMIRARIDADTLHMTVLFLLFVPIMEPEGIKAIFPFLGNLIWGFYIRTFAAGIISIVFLFVTIKRRRIDMPIVCILFYVVASAMISIIKLHSLEGWFSRYLCIICAAFLVAIYQPNLSRLIRVVTIYLKILIIINFVLVMLYPNGIYASNAYEHYNWLLGYKSSLQYYVLPAITFSWIDAVYSRKKLKITNFYIFFGLCIAEAALSRNAMLLIGLSLEAICIVMRVEKRTALLNGATYFLISFMLNVVILFFAQIMLNVQFIRLILIRLGKNMTFTGRNNIIWPNAIEAIKKFPVFGYGVLTSSENIRMLGRGRLGVSHAHNHILQIILDGGFFLFAIYLVFVVIVVYRMMRYKHLRSTQILGMSIFVLLVMSTVEIFTRNSGTGVWMLFILCAMTKDLDSQLNKAFPPPAAG